MIKPIIGKWLLVVSSIIFYWYGIPEYTIVFIASVSFNYLFGYILSIGHMRFKVSTNKLILVTGILFNVLLLVYFKYTDFLIENVNFIFNQDYSLKKIILPIGISFFTFQLIAYLVDSYRGETQNYQLIDYLLFITFFPQLIVGPIVHHKDVVNQYEDKKNQRINFENLSIGLFIFFIGTTKKLLIADSITPLAQEAFNNTESLSILEAWVASLGYTISYYFDLSGYADMAIGLGQMFNIKIPINFNSPYKARNFADYWRRWHITLSKFLGDYIFRSVKVKGGSTANFYGAIFITFLVSGIWHGAGWTFFVWGIINGIFVIMAHALDKAKIKFPFIIAWLLTFLGVIFTRILFVSKRFNDAFNVYRSLFDFKSLTFHDLEYASISQIKFIIFGFLIAVFLPNTQFFVQKFKPNKWFGLFFSILFLATMFNINKVADFLYFQF